MLRNRQIATVTAGATIKLREEDKGRASDVYMEGSTPLSRLLYISPEGKESVLLLKRAKTDDADDSKSLWAPILEEAANKRQISPENLAEILKSMKGLNAFAEEHGAEKKGDKQATHTPVPESRSLTEPSIPLLQISRYVSAEISEILRVKAIKVRGASRVELTQVECLDAVFRGMFAVVDSDASRALSVPELEKCCRLIGLETTQEKVTRVIKEYDDVDAGGVRLFGHGTTRNTSPP